MTITILAFLKAAWPALAGAGIGILGLLFGWAKGKSADAEVAQSGQREAVANQATEAAKTQTAEVRDGEAQANAAAALAGANNAKERANVESDISSLPAGAAAGQLRDEWTAGGAPAAGTGSAGKDPDH